MVQDIDAGKRRVCRFSAVDVAQRFTALMRFSFLGRLDRHTADTRRRRDYLVEFVGKFAYRSFLFSWITYAQRFLEKNKMYNWNLVYS